MAETTTIRVSIKTRDRLKALASRRGEPAGVVIADLVSAADEEVLLAEAETAFENLARDPNAFAAYRSKTRDIETGFEAPTPQW